MNAMNTKPARTIPRAESPLLLAARELFGVSARIRAAGDLDEVTAFGIAARARADLYQVVSSADSRELDEFFEQMRLEKEQEEAETREQRAQAFAESLEEMREACRRWRASRPDLFPPRKRRSAA
jgi:hypothetical protein